MNQQFIVPSKLSISLHESIKSFNLDSVKISYAFDSESINSIDPINGWSPLYKAIVYEQEKIAEFLLQQGADPNVKNNIGESPLHYVCENANTRLAKLLLSHGANPSFPQPDGNTAMHISCKKSDIEMIKVLLKHGCDINIQNNSGRTPLHFVAENNNVALFEFLLQAGADPNIADKWNRKPKLPVRDRKLTESTELKNSRGFEDQRKDTRSSVNLKSSLHDTRSNKPSYSNNMQESFIKENIRDAQKLLQEVSVALPELTKNKLNPTSDQKMSENFQNQLKEVSKLLTERQNLQGNEEPNLKRIKTLRSNKSMATLEKPAENKENTENINPNVIIAQLRERNQKQASKSKQDLSLGAKLGTDSINKITELSTKIAEMSSKVAESSEKNPRIMSTLKQSETFLRLQQFENRVAQLKSPTNSQPIKAFDFSSPKANSITQTKEVVVEQIALQEKPEPKIEENKPLVKVACPIVEETQVTPKPQAEKQEYEVPVTNRVFNPSLKRKSEPKEEERENIHLSKEDPVQTPEEKNIVERSKENLITSNLSLEQSTQETVNSSEKSINSASPPTNLDKQIQQIFLQSSKEKQVSSFKTEHETQTSIDLPIARPSVSRLSIDQAFISIEDWLTAIELQELVDNFKDNGYKYLYEFGNEFYNRKPDDLVYKLGIDKIGHRARIMLKLKEDFGEYQVLPAIKNSQKHPRLETWLKSISMLEYYDNFLDAGYESLDHILVQVGFQDLPFDDKLLRDSLFISDEKDRSEILKQIENLYRATINITPSNVSVGKKSFIFGRKEPQMIANFVRKFVPF